MFRKIIMFSCLSIFSVSLTGCATTHKQKDLEMQGLKNQISVLEAQIQSNDEEIGSLRDALSKTVEEKIELSKETSKKKAAGEVKSRPTVKQTQTALLNAGYDPGSIDGKMGRKTKEAIKAFQKANNLAADGKVGKNTWKLLKEYLDKKIK